MSPKQNICAVCKVPATQICSGCKSVFYCNREHQKKHWKETHKNNCCPYKIIVNEKHGCHIVATRDIKQNEIIFKDTPLVIGPSKSHSIYCIGCNKRLHQKSGEEFRCKNCNWPLCGLKCEGLTFHKTECNIFKDKIKKENSDINYLQKNKLILAIAPLRCLLLKETNSTKYQVFTSLPPCKSNQEQENEVKTIAIPFIQNTLQLKYEDQEILQIASLFDVYSFEILKNEGEVNCRGLFPIAGLLHQHCKPNTKHVFQENNEMILISTFQISRGNLITTSHAEFLWGTLARRSFLQETKNITCQCSRCSDNTELGTYLGAIFCCKCKKPREESSPKILSTDPLNSSAIWKCEKCNHTIRGRQMVWGNDAIKNEINRIDKTVPLQLEQFLVKYKDTLHPKNYHAMVVKFALSQIYGNQDGYLYTDLTDELVERKLEICHELLEVIDELNPGYSKLRGSILYELQAAMVIQTKRDYSKGKITKEAAQDSMIECLNLLKEASQILSSEPEMRDYLKEQVDKFVSELEDID